MGLVTEFKFSMEISRAFRGHNELKWLKSWGPEWQLLPSKYALVFVDNHDNQRGNSEILTYKFPKMYIMAVAFMLAHPYGIPRIMSSFYFDLIDQGILLKAMNFKKINNIILGPPANASTGEIISPIILTNGTCINGWVCEHRWLGVSGMIGFRNNVGNELLVNWWDNGNNMIAFCRGDKGFVVFNNEINDVIVTVNTCLPRGDYCDVISGKKSGTVCTGRTISVNVKGKSLITIKSQSVVAVHSGVSQ